MPRSGSSHMTHTTWDSHVPTHRHRTVNRRCTLATAARTGLEGEGALEVEVAHQAGTITTGFAPITTVL